MNRRSFVTPTAGTSVLLATPRAWSAEDAQPTARDEEILAQAKDRMVKHRQGDGVVTVREAEGQPLPGVRVTVEQMRARF